MATRPSDPITLDDYERLAAECTPEMAREYIAAGAADEVTLSRNRRSFSEILLAPRVLRDVSRIDLSVELLGKRLAAPILLAPTAYHRLVHEEGELATARGAVEAGAPLVVSSFATTAIEDVARAMGDVPWWFQLYVHPDRGFTRSLVQRAEAAGCGALCITVDTPVAGSRDRDRRAGFRLPDELELVNLRDLGTEATRASHLTGSGIYTDILDPSLTWDTIEWIRSFAGVPIVLKGILSPEDAHLAEGAGVDGLIVSNHGARNLDTTPATIEALPGVIEALSGDLPVLLDGGVRRGTDALKALALGARAVLIGRPYLWGLAVHGARGVRRIVEILRTELETAMALCGRTGVDDLDRDLIWNREGGGGALSCGHPAHRRR